MNLNEFNDELVKFIDETVKKVLGKYCVETNNQIVLLQTALNTLMGVLIVHRFPSTEELRAVVTKAMEEKAKELNKINLSGNSEKPKN